MAARRAKQRRQRPLINSDWKYEDRLYELHNISLNETTNFINYVSKSVFYISGFPEEVLNDLQEIICCDVKATLNY